MTTFYVDPAAGGANDGTSWTDAWTNIQSAFDTADDDDIVYCRGSQTLSARIDVDTNTSTNSSGHIKFIGCNGSGVNDGTRFVLNGNSAVANCIYLTGIRDYYWFENLEFKNATSHGFNKDTTACDGIVFINCSFNNNGGYGAYAYNVYQGAAFIRCSFYQNGSHGIYYPSGNTVMLFCSIHDNSGSGMVASYHFGAIMHCLVYDNGDDGLNDMYMSLIYGNVVDGNTDDGINLDTAVLTHPIIIGNRITNHSGAGDIGIDFSERAACRGWNYFEDNDGDNIQNSTYAKEILYDGAATDQEDQADTNEGYTDTSDGSEDFNLRSDATLRRTAIQVPLT